MSTKHIPFRVYRCGGPMSWDGSCGGPDCITCYPATARAYVRQEEKEYWRGIISSDEDEEENEDEDE
jgi:hypothetical protein